MCLVSRLPQLSFIYLASVYVLDPNLQPVAPPLINFENGVLGIVGNYFHGLFGARSFDFPSHKVTSGGQVIFIARIAAINPARSRALTRAFSTVVCGNSSSESVSLFDTCESGSLTREHVTVRGLERLASLERLTLAVGRTILSASTEDAPAFEGYRGHGVFTFSVLDAIEQGDANGDGFNVVVAADVAKCAAKRHGRRATARFSLCTLCRFGRASV